MASETFNVSQPRYVCVYVYVLFIVLMYICMYINLKRQITMNPDIYLI